MSSCVPWTFEDTDTLNPFERPGAFDFNVWYELDQFASEFSTDYGNVPAIEIIGVTCTHVQFDDENRDLRRPTENENEQLSDWFYNYIDIHLDEHEALKDLAFKYSFVDVNDE
jgi:hypothetical protein